MNNPDPNSAREIIHMLRERATDKERALAAAQRIQATRYIGSEFVADARVLARYIIAETEGR